MNTTKHTGEWATTNSSTSPQIDKADTSLSSHPTHNEGHVDGTTTFIFAPPQPLPSQITSITEVSDQTYGSQARIDELSESQVQSADLPPNSTDTQVPPLVSVQHPSQSQPNDSDQAQSTTSRLANKNTFSHGSRFPIPADSTASQGGHQLPSESQYQCSPESSRVPTAPRLGPQTHFSRPGDIPASFPPMHDESRDLNLPPLNTAPPTGAYGHNESQSQAPVSPVSLSQHILVNAKVDAVTPPVVPFDRPSSSPHPQDIPPTSQDPQCANQSPFGPYISDSPYLPYSQYPDPPNGKSMSPRPIHSPRQMTYASKDSVSGIKWHEVAHGFLVFLLGQIYLYFLLRLPSFYFHRLVRIFEEANLPLHEIKKLVLETASQGITRTQKASDPQCVPLSFQKLVSAWESFIDSMKDDWKTLNVVSVLLLSAVPTILQIGGAAEDPLIRYTALLSLMCSLISLLFGCICIIRFGGMQSTYKIAEWALEAQRTKTSIWWNVWIMLAMPAIWLGWSIILYIICIMSFVWRTGGNDTRTPALSDTALQAIRISITIVLGFGVLYGFLIMATFQRYGSAMDRKWKHHIGQWVDDHAEGGTELSHQPAPANAPIWSYPEPPTIPPINSTDNLPKTDVASLNQLYNLQTSGGTTAAAYASNMPVVTPPPLVPKEPIGGTAEDGPPPTISRSVSTDI